MVGAGGLIIKLGSTEHETKLASLLSVISLTPVSALLNASAILRFTQSNKNQRWQVPLASCVIVYKIHCNICSCIAPLWPLCYR